MRVAISHKRHVAWLGVTLLNDQKSRKNIYITFYCLKRNIQASESDYVIIIGERLMQYKNTKKIVRCEVFTAMTMKNAVFWMWSRVDLV
jgi:hypothetical protein